MQIDTWNRNTTWGDPFEPGPEPAASQAPLNGPDATYSGHLECPCTDRVKKIIENTFATQIQGKCSTAVVTANECFSSISQIGITAASVLKNSTVSSTTLPGGCSVVMADAENATVFFNTEPGSACGGSSNSTGQLVGIASIVGGIKFGLQLDTALAGGVATITITGPADVWFGLGLGAQQMSDSPNAIIVGGNGTVWEQKLADQQAGEPLPMSLKVLSNTVSSGVRTVVVSRPFKGLTPKHYNFNPTAESVNFIGAIGRSPSFSYHRARGASALSLKALGVPTCICNTGKKGYITTDMNPAPQVFSKACAPEPYADLLANKNPTCFIETYAGGLKCCKSGNILLDKDQNPWADNKLTYYIKFRFWFEEYAPASSSTQKASHQNLVRFFHQTEQNAGEYDVVRAPEGTAPDDTVYQITAHFQVRDGVAMCNPRTSPHCAGASGSGIMLIYSSCHCHAPACISCELWNADTGELLCRQVPVFGESPAATPENPYDERGYIAIPPCLYGPESEGLYPPTYLSYDTNLTSIKKNNNTYGHYGEMAMWQMRGYQAYE
mmetsp:Transcript_11909/g.30617  ORF Transcript_11909/g.30617 Transcript_11909/m.30617 type:complete len:553 (+) Transcript_11909:1-1659(+)